MTSRTASLERIIAVVVSSLLALIALLAIPAPARGDGEPLDFVLTGLSPAVVRPSDTLELTGTLTNSGTSAFTDPQVQIAVQWTVPRTVDGVTGWFDTSSPPSARLEYTGQLTLTVAPGATSSVRIAVPMSEITFPIRYDNWGARGLEVTLTGAESSATARTMGVFYPDEDLDAEPVRVAALVAATPTASEWRSALPSNQLTDATAAERIRAATSIQGASVALDPAVLNAAATQTAIALPWADADLGLLAGAGELDRVPLAEAEERAKNAFEASAVDATYSIAWPLPSDVDGDLVRVLRQAGYDNLVLAESALPETDGDTRDARVDVLVGGSTGNESAEAGGATSVASGEASGEPNADDGEGRAAATTMRAVVGDAGFSSALLGYPGTSGVDPELTARQIALATTAVVARQTTAAENLLAIIDRAAAARLDSALSLSITSRLAVIESAPWVELVDVPSMLEQETDQSVEGSTLAATGNVTTQQRTSVADASMLTRLTTDLASAFEDDSRLLALEQTLTITPSTAWRAAGSSGAEVVEAVRAQLDAITTGVTVAPPESNVNLFAEESALPITVTNTLDVPVTVHIKVTPELPALRIEGTPDVTLEPLSTQTVRVPVTALANGVTQVDVDVTSPDGAPLGERATFQMTVQAEWESVTTTVLAVALGVLLVVGLVRNIRRGRRRDDGVPAPAPPQHRSQRKESAS